MSVRHHSAAFAFVALAEVAAAQTVPLPRPRPPVEIGKAPEPSACLARLAATRAAAESIPDIDGPGDCGGNNLVRLETVVLPNNNRVEITPPAVVRCEMAETIVGWLRDDVARFAAETFGSSVRSVRTYTSYQCRGRNNLAGGVTSEHGKANALDVGSIILANGKTIDPTASMS